MRIRVILLTMALLVMGARAWAQESPVASSAALGGVARDGAAAHDTEVDAHPDLSADDGWAYIVVKSIVIMFILAALAGLLVGRNVPQEVPPAHSHDEPPGSSHHHGKSGTLMPDAHH